jgi:hypothetical protein
MCCLAPFARLALGTLALGLLACSDGPEVSSGLGMVGVGADGGQGTLEAGAGLVGDGGVLLPGDSGAVFTVADAGQGCGSVKARSEPVKPPVDVVWILDGSGSMGPHALAVGDNMLRFMDNVRSSGADINVVMLTGFAFGPALQLVITDTNYHWVYAEVQSTDAFRNALGAYPEYKQFLRPAAPTHFIVVTDDESDMPASEFLTTMMSQHGRPFFLHAVAADGDFLSGGNCPGSGSGSEYFSAAQTTRGDSISLCADWAANFQELQGTVIASAPLPCEYPIPAAPNGQTLNPEAVQVLYTPKAGVPGEFAKALQASQCADFPGWYFDNNSAPKNVKLCPKACESVAQGGAIDIAFGCAPSVLLL